MKRPEPADLMYFGGLALLGLGLAAWSLAAAGVVVGLLMVLTAVPLRRWIQ